MIAYIIAGALLGTMFPAFLSILGGRCITVTFPVTVILSFIGGVGGHLVFTLLNH